MTLRKMHALILLMLIFAVGIGLRYQMYAKMIPTFEEVGVGPFAKESASHYRYARMIAEGQTVPEIDYQAQYPEGLKVTDDSILEEYVVGYLYRFLPVKSIPFDRFVSWFVMLFSGLSIFAVYHMSRTFSRNRFVSLLATLLYTISLPAILRNVGTEFAREHLSLPFIFFHASFFIRAIDLRVHSKSRFINAVLSGVCLFVALASWKLSRFYILIFAGFLVLQYIMRKDHRPFRMPVLIIFAWASLAGLLVPHLRADLFLTSLPMVLLFSMIILEVVDRYGKRIDGPLLRIGCVAGLFGGLFLILPHSERFGHVFGTTLYQLRFLFQHPGDPSFLSPVARLYWVPGYTHPSLYALLVYFTIPLAAAAYGVFRYAVRLFRGKSTPTEQFLLYFFLATFASYLLFSRLHVFFIFFVAICIGVSIEAVFSILTGRKWKIAVFALLAVMGIHQIVQALGTWDPLYVLRVLRIRPVQEEMFLENIVNISEVINWTRENTPPESVMLSYWHISAFLLTYADRTTVLHTFWEDVGMRNKVINYATALYGDEETFYAYCRKYGVTYFVYSARHHLDYSILGTRFLADRLPVDSGSFVFTAHFFPERLTHFGLRYQNDCFRIYEVLEDASEKTDGAVDYQPVFDPRFSVTDIDKVMRFGEEISLAYYYYYSGVENWKRGSSQAALQLLKQSINICPGLTNGWSRSARILEEEGLTGEAISAYQQLLTYDAGGPQAAEAKAAVERLYAVPFGTYRFLGSSQVDIDTTYTGAVLSLKSDSVFSLVNPGFEDENGRQFTVVEYGTYSVTDSVMTFRVVRQEPAGFDYYYLFAPGENGLLFSLRREHLTLHGGSPSGGLISLDWQR